MRKEEFLLELRKKLSGLPQDEIDERVMFYDEMINDRMEEGLSEEAAVSEIGKVDEIMLQIISDIPLAKLVKESVRPKSSIKAWEIVLLALGSPIWLSLLLAAFAVILAVYVVVGSVVVSLWALEASLVACSLAGIVSAVVVLVRGNGLIGMIVLGTGFFCTGLSVFLFFGCKGITRGILLLTPKMVLGLKSLFVGKENFK